MRSEVSTSTVVVVVAAVVAALGVGVGARMPFVFPADYEFITGQVVETFSCVDRPYGYYADVDNACRVFHICLPIPDDLGQIIETAHFSFICGNQTIFDQETLTCNHPEYAYPCQDAPTLYDSRNALFGRVNDQF